MARDREFLGRFDGLKFEDFRRMAKDSSLSKHEKVGFPDSYREGKEQAIFTDILSKLTHLRDENQIVLEIGPGCGDLPRMLFNLCETQRHRLVFVDSEEMLANLPGAPFVQKLAAYYPKCPTLFEEYRERVNVILCYSVLHYIFVEGNVWEFLDKSLGLLAYGGQMLIGDIPNISKRKRFFSSPAGIRFHKEFTRREGEPDVKFNQLEGEKIDDGVIVGILMRARMAGFDAYVISQDDALPMANRREDILITRP